MDNSWIKLHRKFIESPLWKYSIQAHYPLLISFWIYLLTSANWEEKKWYDGKQEVLIPPGSLIFSLKHMAEFFELKSVQPIRTCIKHLENMKMITHTSTSKWTQVWIVNWGKYQMTDNSNNTHTNKPLTNDKQTANKPLTTTKEYKNIRNKELYREELLEILSVWNITRNLINGKGIKSFKAIEDNYAYWRNEYSFEDIQKAIKKTILDKTFLGVISIDTFFRQMNPNREKVDYIGKALSFTEKSTIDKSGMETYGYIKRN